MMSGGLGQALPNLSRSPVPTIEAAGATDIGCVRSQNEDAYLIATLQRSMVVHDSSAEYRRGWLTGDTAGTLLVVADGMGGMGGGSTASRIAVQTITSYLLNVMPWVAERMDVSAGRASLTSVPSVRDQLSSAVVVSDSTVRSAGASIGEPRMGTTLTMALLLWPTLYVAHVGDSRCYLFRSGTLTRLTTDHTLAQQCLDQGMPPLGDDSGLHHWLWNSLGGRETAKPQTTKLRLEPADVLLLCSDGLTMHLSEDEIAKTVAGSERAADLCSNLVARAKAAGGSDNVTVVIARRRV
jgi:protein phosphatase